MIFPCSAFFLAILVTLVVSEPNEMCKSEPTGVFVGSQVTCGVDGGSSSRIKIEIPGNVDLTLLPEDMRTLFLRSQHYGLIADGFKPLPARKRLTSVGFSGFNGDATAPRFPLAALLANNKERLELLRLTEVKLIRLTVEDFSGFSRLQEISFGYVQLETISVGVFDELGLLPSGKINPDYQSELAEIMIYSSKIKELDWSFLKPIAKSVTRVYLASNGLTSSALTCSRPFEFEKQVFVGLDSNHLSTLPADVYATLSRYLPHSISMQAQTPNFCPDSKGCECCEIHEYVQWLRENDQITGVMSCGADDNSRFGQDFLELRADIDLHKHCQPLTIARPVKDAVDWRYVAKLA